MSGFAELVAATNYSFLRGASHPKRHRALWPCHLGLTGIGIADRNTVAGVVRAWAALRDARRKARARAALKDKAGCGPPARTQRAPKRRVCRTDLKLVVGARLVFDDGTPDIVAYPATRRGWGRLTSLLTHGNLRAVKGDCILHLDDLLAHLETCC